MASLNRCWNLLQNRPRMIKENFVNLLISNGRESNYTSDPTVFLLDGVRFDVALW
jgi:hypothetical protein